MIDSSHHITLRDALAAAVNSRDRVLYLPAGAYEASYLTIPHGVAVVCAPRVVLDVSRGPITVDDPGGLSITGMPTVRGDGDGVGMIATNLRGARLELAFQNVRSGLHLRGDSFYNRFLLWCDQIEYGVEVEEGPCNDNHLLAGSRFFCSKGGLRFRAVAHNWTGIGVAFEGSAQHLLLRGEDHNFLGCRFEITAAAPEYEQPPVVLQSDTARCHVTGRRDYAFHFKDYGTDNHVEVG